MKTSLTYAENDDASGVRCPTDVKSAGFRSQVEASRGSSNTGVIHRNSLSVDDSMFYLTNMDA